LYFLRLNPGGHSIPKVQVNHMLERLEKHRILYVEDHEDTREMVKIILGENEFDVITAATIEDGVHLAHDQHFDLYLLDLWLPDGIGLELARAIREVDNETPIVFFSAAAYETDRLEAMHAGAQAYLTKPAKPSEICRVISSLIEFNEVVHNTQHLSVC
jgi:DNA-binding response OmpR family regulator